eukprot:TRINITY_DN3077_c0_g1_i2.p1 TRINITY_DN3077_c0_g1~~TRINITY_DN3077_c0_g1_i2.p1  ORF type:complete len:542 (+),score=110.41 TRINITY_DN3077_c0_g1_i2:43-1626(+)
MGSSFSKKNETNPNSVDNDKIFKPIGLYPDLAWDARSIKQMILEKKLAPFYPGCDPDSLNEASPLSNVKFLEECPICFLYYPGGLNRSKCCKKGVCSECFLRIKDPKISSIPCPFCNSADYCVVFTGPLSEEERKKEEDEQQKVLNLQQKMREEEIQRDIQREKERAEAKKQAASINSEVSVVKVEKVDDSTSIRRQQPLTAVTHDTSSLAMETPSSHQNTEIDYNSSYRLNKSRRSRDSKSDRSSSSSSSEKTQSRRRHKNLSSSSSSQKLESTANPRNSHSSIKEKQHHRRTSFSFGLSRKKSSTTPHNESHSTRTRTPSITMKTTPPNPELNNDRKSNSNHSSQNTSPTNSENYTMSFSAPSFMDFQNMDGLDLDDLEDMMFKEAIARSLVEVGSPHSPTQVHPLTNETSEKELLNSSTFNTSSNILNTDVEEQKTSINSDFFDVETSEKELLNSSTFNTSSNILNTDVEEPRDSETIGEEKRQEPLENLLPKLTHEAPSRDVIWDELNNEEEEEVVLKKKAKV